MGFMVGFVKSYHRRYPDTDYEDLLQEASVGMLQAYQAYDPDKGYSFLTLAKSYLLSRLYEWRHQYLIRIPKKRLKQQNLPVCLILKSDDIPLEGYPDDHIGCESLTVNKDLLSKRNSFFRCFPEAQAEIFRDVFIEGMDYPTVALLHGIKAQSVYQLVTRKKIQIQQNIKNILLES
jgi:RNA polymerase sigma factor (sigma-70 family)